MREHGELRRIDLAIYLTDKWEIDARDELDCRWRIWVVLATSYLETVDAVLMYGLIMHIDRC